jgi:high-affinity nickel-transport protein
MDSWYRDRPRARLAVLFIGLIAANVGAWVWAWIAFADRPALLASSLLAWVFGLRHAVDADHIAAIDNVVRKLMRDGQRPLAVGLYFSLGHSTVVALACIAVAGTASVLTLGPLKGIGSTLGTSVSAAFLLVIAIINVAILRDTWRKFQRIRSGAPVAASELGQALPAAGVLGRLLGPLIRAVSRSRHMYPLGFLFGLGFDTATEIGLLALAATQAAQGMSAWQVLVFPALFTAGMALVDTADSVLMVGVYGWAGVHPLRKLWYNVTVTAAAVAVALLIGGMETLGLVADRFELTGGVWSVVVGMNDQQTALGIAVIAIFAASWAISAIVLRWKRYDVPAR